MIPMRQNDNSTCLSSVQYLCGNKDILQNCASVSTKTPFAEETVLFLDAVSKQLLSDREAKQYSDVITYAFWLRKASLMELQKRFQIMDGNVRLGRGVVFHIAPSNVPVNYAYSLVAGLIMGNVNIVKIPSKDFPQVFIINKAIEQVLLQNEEFRSYITLLRYGHEQEVNDYMSNLADVRIIWGGDQTIQEIRHSPLGPRATEITFADRFSIAVIDADTYIISDRQGEIELGFYNDTYLTDQNACTSPRLVVWMGKQKEQAKELFWKHLYELVKTKYFYQSIQCVNKLTHAYLLATACEEAKIIAGPDNRLMRIQVDKITNNLMNFKDNSGYFIEYDCDDIMELRDICNDNHCQTVAYVGNPHIFEPLILSGIGGIDRIVPVGKTLDFDLVWDGYNLYERLSRSIMLRK